VQAPGSPGAVGVGSSVNASGDSAAVMVCEVVENRERDELLHGDALGTSLPFQGAPCEAIERYSDGSILLGSAVNSSGPAHAHPGSKRCTRPYNGRRTSQLARRLIGSIEMNVQSWCHASQLISLEPMRSPVTDR